LRLLVAQYTAPAITRRTIHCSCDYSSHNTLLLRLLVANLEQLANLINYSPGIFILLLLMSHHQIFY
ncbi:MAG: hypothetical protein L0K24_09955, partial [Tetragenococcus koreensis]|nr:hypothetical protein [Tetragenococcus koreensis]